MFLGIVYFYIDAKKAIRNKNNLTKKNIVENKITISIKHILDKIFCLHPRYPGLIVTVWNAGRRRSSRIRTCILDFGFADCRGGELKSEGAAGFVNPDPCILFLIPPAFCLIISGFLHTISKIIAIQQNYNIIMSNII